MVREKEPKRKAAKSALAKYISKQKTRGGNNVRITGGHDEEFKALQKEMERRERILADRVRVSSKWRPKVPEVRMVNWENFKNRFQDPSEPDYAVDVLCSGPDLQAQMRREQTSRRREDQARMRQRYLALRDESYLPKPVPEDKMKRNKKNEQVSAANTDIQRIRIQSQPILGHLTNLLNDMEERSTPRTFMRPFKALVYFQPKMKEILSTLEEKWADVEDFDQASDIEPIATPAEERDVAIGKQALAESDDEDEGNEDEDDEFDDTESLLSVDSNEDDDYVTLMDSPEALRDMRAYVSFIDNQIMPLYGRFDGSDATRVAFDDLWSLFRMGDLIYMPASSEAGGRYHEVWRVYRVECPQKEPQEDSPFWNFFSDEINEGFDPNAQSKFRISAYMIDNDGQGYGAVRRKFEISSFVGERQINSLEVYPLRYRDDYKSLLASLGEQGRKFVQYTQERHHQYSAWTLTRNPPAINYPEPEDEILEDSAYEKMRHPEFVESDVMVDLTEAYQRMGSWRPEFYKPEPNRTLQYEIKEEDVGIQHWFDGARHNLAYEQKEIVQKLDGVELRQRRDTINSDPFLRARIWGSRTFETDPQSLRLRDEDLVLLPKRMFAYALRERRFMPIDLNLLKPVRMEPGVFENLRIQEDYKQVVRGLVMSHFQKKALERRYADASTEGPGQDLIQGKGRGLVVLLHGVPGVGKTATAEAVAMENKKPLFVITCGDLGLSPHEVESSLKNVFRLAHLWDCVLLLDEADVFLTQRSRSDMKRNALVSVFLRVLEYYNGLLFLTTNRVGTIDEAFKSRIHLSLYYPPLDKLQTRDIFRLNISKLKEMETERQRMTGDAPLVIKEAEILEFATEHYEELARSTGCWNGRQIRSAFQIASSLALHSHTLAAEAARARGQQGPVAPVLDRSFFDKVQMSTQSFDRHMKKESSMYDDQSLPMRGTFEER